MTLQVDEMVRYVVTSGLRAKLLMPSDTVPFSQLMHERSCELLGSCRTLVPRAQEDQAVHEF